MFIGVISILLLAALTLEEKVGQVLMVHFHGDKANDEAATLIQDLHVGGIIYYDWANELSSFDQVKTLSAGLQSLSTIPLLISVDQEGGKVARLKKGFTQFAGNGPLGKTENPKLARQEALIMGRELKAAGINLNLAPVVDVNSNPNNPIIGTRSFGTTPELVITFADEALKGFHEAGIMTTLKHFPGHGDVSVDPHEDLPFVTKSIEELERVELAPFIKLAPHTEAIMTAHVMVPALDAEHCATLSKKILSRLSNFEGLIISDSLIMDGVLKQAGTVDEAAIMAFNAGCDVLLLGGKLFSGKHADFELTLKDVKRVHQSILKAVKEGRIEESRLDQSVEKILQLKTRFFLSKSLNLG